MLKPASTSTPYGITFLYQDDALVAVSKPVGLVVHEAPGPGPSLLRVLREAHGLDGLKLVHRLDKDVSGVLLLGKSKAAAAALQAQWNTVVKTYVALCEGAPELNEGLIDAPILEHQTGRPSRMKTALYWWRDKFPNAEMPSPPPPKTSAVHPAGRTSQTRYRVKERFHAAERAWSFLELSPVQGRMHQIRVHLQHAGWPLAVDKLYGRRTVLQTADLGREGEGVLLTRVPLHAARLEFPHPLESGRRIAVEAPMPEDFTLVLELLRNAR